MPGSVVSTKDELHLFRSWSHPVGQCLRYSVRYNKTSAHLRSNTLKAFPREYIQRKTHCFLHFLFPTPHNHYANSSTLLDSCLSGEVTIYPVIQAVCFDHFLFTIVSQISTLYISIVVYMRVQEVIFAFSLNSLLWNPLTFTVPPEWPFQNSSNCAFPSMESLLWFCRIEENKMSLHNPPITLFSLLSMTMCYTLILP